MASDDPMIAALLRERDGYLRTGRPERAALVDEQLALRGHREPRHEQPQGRSTAPQETADEAPKRTRPTRKPTQDAG